MQNSISKKSLVIMLLVVILAASIASFFIFTDSNPLSGKVVSESIICTDSDGSDAWMIQGTVTLKESDGTTMVYTDNCEGTSTVDYVCEGNSVVKHVSTSKDCLCQNGACVRVICSGNECNPSNTKQICSQGKWIDCIGESVCSSQVCITPSKADVKYIGGGSSGDSGGPSSTSSSSTTPVSTETVRSIGTLSGAKTEDIAINEKILFTSKNIEHSLKASELLTTTMTFSLDGNSYNLVVGDERKIDFDGNGDDLSIILKSISMATNKANVLITVL